MKQTLLTQKSSSKQSDEFTTDTNNQKVNLMTIKPIRSLRPMKSMIKVSSLRPKRIQVSAKLRRKAIKA